MIRMFREYLLPITFLSIMLLVFPLCADDTKEIPVEKPTVPTAEKQDTTHYFTPLQFSFFAPLQVFPKDFNVYGVKLNMPYGYNNTVAGFDLGIANRSDTLYGVGVAAFLSKRTGNMYGINMSGIFNLSKGDANGLSAAGFFNEVNTLRGVQMATLCNQAKKVNGVQFGLFNMCHDMDGVQIGLLNYCEAQPFRYTLLFNFWSTADCNK